MLSGGPLLRVGEVPLPGAHMRHDVLAAPPAARLVGATPDAIAEGIRSFRGVPHRLETIAEAGGVRWVNDSQATIPAAAIAALEAFAPSPIVLIAGGQGKGLEYGGFADAIADRSRTASLIGETADELERRNRGRVAVHRVTPVKRAVR